MKAILERKIEEGIRINDDECRFLFDKDIPYLACLAGKARKRIHPNDQVTFVIDVNINITNVCACECDFCAFYKDATSPEQFVLSTDHVLAKIERLVEVEGTQVMLQGGINHALDLEYYCSLLRAIKSRFDVYIHSFSPPEIAYLAERNTMSFQAVLTALKNAGLDSLPGGGAEMLVDRVRSTISPKKIDKDTWLKVMRAAYEVGLESTATMMFGSIETIEERIKHLKVIRDFQDETHNFRAFIPWTFSPRNTRLSHVIMAGGGEYLKMLAISRIYLDNVANIGSGWVTEGMKVAQLGLLCGANDMGGILMEERVLKTTGLENATNQDELVEVIKHAGFSAAKRNSKYEILEVI
ncbi:cyclic dehypoxanthinyl futalosine synthase [Candidatus Omnitrophota bacterium]